jgi:hypothetical protein
LRLELRSVNEREGVSITLTWLIGLGRKDGIVVFLGIFICTGKKVCELSVLQLDEKTQLIKN